MKELLLHLELRFIKLKKINEDIDFNNNNTKYLHTKISGQAP